MVPYIRNGDRCDFASETLAMQRRMLQCWVVQAGAAQPVPNSSRTVDAAESSTQQSRAAELTTQQSRRRSRAADAAGPLQQSRSPSSHRSSADATRAWASAAAASAVAAALAEVAAAAAAVAARQLVAASDGEQRRR